MASRNSILQMLKRQQIPLGTNELKSKDLYKLSHSEKKNTIDFWYKQTLYGRIDSRGNSIYPTETNFKEFRGSEGVYALNFVVDAYDNFIDTFTLKYRNDPEFLKEKYLSPTELIPKKGWTSVNVMFHNQVSNTYKAFVDQYLRNNSTRSEQVVSFGDFVEKFLEFFDLVGTMSPMTRTGIISNLWCTPNISGLCVEFALEDYSVDFNKHNDIFKSKFYYGYLDAAEKNGFFVDKNAPWRLVADLDSQYMQQYMSRYGASPDNLHRQYYIKSYLYDIPALRIYFRQFYNSFISSRPTIRFQDDTTLNRSVLTDAEYERRYNTDYWIWLYAKIRQSEVVDKLNKLDFDRVVERAKNIRKYLDIRRAIVYINSKFLGQLVPTV